MRKQKGFSLIELLIVVAIILIIAAIAIPNLQRAKMSANEAAAVSNIHTIFTAEAAYYAAGWSNPGALGFSNALQDLGSSKGCTPPKLDSACQLDEVLANATTPGTAKNGYYFTYVPTPSGPVNVGFTVNGESVSLRNLRVWEAKPNPNWETTKASIPPALAPAAAAKAKPAK